MGGNRYVGFSITDLSQGEADRIASYLFAHSGKWIAELAGNPIKVEMIGDGKAIVTFPALAEVDVREFMSMLGGER